MIAYLPAPELWADAFAPLAQCFGIGCGLSLICWALGYGIWFVVEIVRKGV